MSFSKQPNDMFKMNKNIKKHKSDGSSCIAAPKRRELVITD